VLPHRLSIDLGDAAQSIFYCDNNTGKLDKSQAGFYRITTGKKVQDYSVIWLRHAVTPRHFATDNVTGGCCELMIAGRKTSAV